MNYVNVDRATPMLLPMDMRDWVAANDSVHFILEAVEHVELHHFKLKQTRSGKAQYPPRMMLALLIYCYSHGIFSSRKIEGATYRDIYVRYLTADTHPDHDTICSWRNANEQAISTCFVEVLKLARELKLLKLGTIAIDGTHIRANASKDKNLTYERAEQLDTLLEQDIEVRNIDLYVSVQNEATHKQRRYDYRPDSARNKPAKKINDPLLLDMRKKLRTEAGQEIYSKRQQSVEPAFGIIKDAMGFRQFLHRGLAKVQNEWKLVCLAYNCKRLFNLIGQAKAV